jgi:hypothetical protein
MMSFPMAAETNKRESFGVALGLGESTRTNTRGGWCFGVACPPLFVFQHPLISTLQVGP